MNAFNDGHNNAVKLEPVEPKEEPPDEEAPHQQSPVFKDVKKEKETPQECQDPEQIRLSGFDFSDILELSDRELAKRIYQAETGIKYLYFVLTKKTDQMRYLVKAKKLKSQFIDARAQSSKVLGKGRGRPPSKTLLNCDPARADSRTLKRVLMDDAERAKQSAKRAMRQRERRMMMTKEELEEERAKARRKVAERRARMSEKELEEARRKRAKRDREKRKRKRMGALHSEGNDERIAMEQLSELDEQMDFEEDGTECDDDDIKVERSSQNEHVENHPTGE